MITRSFARHTANSDRDTEVKNYKRTKSIVQVWGLAGTAPLSLALCHRMEFTHEAAPAKACALVLSLPN